MIREIIWDIQWFLKEHPFLKCLFAAAVTVFMLVTLVAVLLLSAFLGVAVHPILGAMVAYVCIVPWMGTVFWLLDD